MGGFIYCIGSLNFMRSYDETRYVLAGTIGVIYVFFCIIYLIIFIQETIRSVNVINVISDIFEETIPVIEREVEERDHDSLSKEFEENDQYFSIKSDKTGYFEYLNITSAKEKLKEFPGIFVVNPKTGDFVIEGQEIGRIYLETEEEQEEYKEKCKDILKLFQIQENQISITNYRYGINKIVQIAIMGLSSGIKAPTTTVHCVRKLSILLSKLASVNPNHHIENLDKGGKIYRAANNFKEDFYYTIMPIVNLGKTNALVVISVFEGLTIIASKATMKNKILLKKLGENIYNQTIKNFTFETDIEEITKMYERFEEIATGNEEI